MYDLHASFGLAAFVPGAPFVLRLRQRGRRILAQFGSPSVAVPGAGLLDGQAWTAPIDTGLPPRTDRAAAIEWARTAFPGAEVRWDDRRRQKKTPQPMVSGDGALVYGDGQARKDLPIVTASTPARG